MAVLKLVRHSNRETVTLLDGLSELAQRDEVDDVIICYRSRKGGQMKIARTGLYRAQPAEALRAIMQVSVYLTGIEDQVRGTP